MRRTRVGCDHMRQAEMSGRRLDPRQREDAVQRKEMRTLDLTSRNSNIMENLGRGRGPCQGDWEGRMEKQEGNYEALMSWVLRDLNVEMCTRYAAICFR